MVPQGASIITAHDKTEIFWLKQRFLTEKKEIKFWNFRLNLSFDCHVSWLFNRTLLIEKCNMRVGSETPFIKHYLVKMSEEFCGAVGLFLHRKHNIINTQHRNKHLPND